MIEMKVWEGQFQNGILDSQLKIPKFTANPKWLTVLYGRLILLDFDGDPALDDNAFRLVLSLKNPECVPNQNL